MNSNSKHSNWFNWIVDPEIQELLESNVHSDPASLALKLTPFPQEKRNFILNQITCHRIAQKKFPSLANSATLIYPAKQSIEQASSELTAKYKSGRFGGKTCIDLTAGFGVDSYYFSIVYDSVVLVEKSEVLLDLCKYNFKALNVKNASFFCSDASSFLDNVSEKVDLVYVDPSRRKGDKRILDIRDYDPNIVDLMSGLLEKAHRILIKLSPISDIQQIIHLIPNLSSLTVVSVKNECKEILVDITEGMDFDHRILTVDLTDISQRSYSFDIKEETKINLENSDVKKYLFLPMTAAVKAGAFKSLSRDFNVEKISGNTHIYTSSELVENFPGKTFECLETLPFNKKQLKQRFAEQNFNVVCRNFPLKPEQVAKKLDIADSGERYLLAYRNHLEELRITVARIINA